MFRVLLVDDEKMIRDGLKSFNWKLCNCEIIGEANNGQSALTMAGFLAPDIIISDIKMPELDGLSFISRAKEILPEVEILLITGYNNFEFAHKAIQIGVSNYLLKPIDLSILQKNIQKICNRIKLRKNQNEMLFELNSKLDEIKPLLRSKIASDLLNGRILDMDSLHQKLHLLDLSIKKYIIISCKTISTENDTSSEYTKVIREYGIINLAEETIRKACSDVFIEGDNLFINGILIFNEDFTDEDILYKMKNICMELKQNIYDTFGSNLCIGISNINDEIIEINQFFQQAFNACQQQTFFDDDSITFYKDIILTECDTWYISDGIKNRLYRDISLGDIGNISSTIQLIIDAISNNNLSAEYLKSILLDLAISSIKYLKTAHMISNQKYLEEVHKIMNIVNESTTYEKLMKNIESILSEYAMKNNEVGKKHYNRLVNSIIEFIEKNYSSDISLDVLAEKFKLSSSYVGKLIKKYSNKSFIDILMDIRMRNSRRLIIETDMQVQEISASVGYNDTSYFIQVFKRKHGVTPREFKEIHENS